MIEISYWIQCIHSYCQFVADSNLVRKVWIDKDTSITSAMDIGELYEQIFDDLDSQNVFKNAAKELSSQPALAQSIGKFLHALKKADAFFESPACNKNYTRLLESSEWKNLQAAAIQTIAALK